MNAITSTKKVLVIDDLEDRLLYEVLPLPGVDGVEDLFETEFSFRPDVIFTDQGRRE